MSEFKIGDKVKVVESYYRWQEDQALVPLETILTVVEGNRDTDYFSSKENMTIELEGVNSSPASFELVKDDFDYLDIKGGTSTLSANQKDLPIGTTIRCIETDSNWYEVGDIHVTRGNPFMDLGKLNAHVEEEESDQAWVTLNQFEVVSYPSMYEVLNNDSLTPHDIDGSIARPILSERKVGKVQMNMVEDGFPNALKELAKLMTWAAVTKEYSLHDWKRLPNAALEFPNAAGRHRNEGNIQKASGLEAKDRVDPESSLLHKVHEVFNGLAEIELILTGVIK